MRFALLLLFLSTSTVQAQTWTHVAAPSRPLVRLFYEEQSQLSNHVWMYPYTQPTPAGVYEVSNAIIDKSQKVGAWSQPRVLKMQSGWFLSGHCWNQPVTADEAGIAWKVKVISIGTDFPYNPYQPGSEHYYYTGWSGGYQPNFISPYSFTTPRLNLLTEDAYRAYRLNMLAPGGRHTLVAPPPVCSGSNLPCVPMEISWCRVTETGETALAPSFIFTPPSLNSGWTMAETCRLHFALDEQHPQGTIGYHVYVKLGGVWKRVPAAHCFGEPTTVDDWLWQWHDRRPVITRLAANAPTHVPHNQPRSRLNDLQLSLKNTYGNVVVGQKKLPSPLVLTPVQPLPQNPTIADLVGTLVTINTNLSTISSKMNELIAALTPDNNPVVVDTYCPIIDEYSGWPWKGGRRITAKDGGKWTITQKQSQSGHKYWPVLAIENSYSQWIGVEAQANGGSAAVSFGDFSGGQAFGTRFVDCNFYATSSPTGITCGFLIDSNSTAQSSHTASEIKCYNCKLNGDICIWIGGNQSAGVKFNETNMTSTGSGRQCSVVYLECPNQVFFLNGTNVDAPNGGAVFRAAVYPAKLLVEGIWLDQYSPCLIEGSGVSVDAKFTAGKLNARGNRPLLARLVAQQRLSKLSFSSIDLQPDPGTTGYDIVNGWFNGVDIQFADTILDDFVTLREPSFAQLATGNLIPWIAPVETPMPGMKITIPATQQELSIGPVQEQSIVFNSLTGRQAIKRANWTD